MILGYSAWAHGAVEELVVVEEAVRRLIGFEVFAEVPPIVRRIVGFAGLCAAKHGGVTKYSLVDLLQDMRVGA